MTPEQLEKAMRARAEGYGWHTVAKRSGATYYSVRAELDPGYREMAARHVRRARAIRREIEGFKIKAVRRALEPKRPEYQAPGFTAAQLHEPRPVVPRHVLFERDRVMTAPRSLTAICFGDPPPGRSALDKLAEKHGYLKLQAAE